MNQIHIRKTNMNTNSNNKQLQNPKYKTKILNSKTNSNNSNRHIINHMHRMKRIKRSKSCDPNEKNKIHQKIKKDKLSIYPYNNKGQINTNKNKKKLVHAKSIFSSEIGAYYNFYNNKNNNNNKNESQNTNIKLNINGSALILSLPIDCILVCHTFDNI